MTFSTLNISILYFTYSFSAKNKLASAHVRKHVRSQVSYVSSTSLSMSLMSNRGDAWSQRDAILPTHEKTASIFSDVKRSLSGRKKSYVKTLDEASDIQL